MSTKSAATLTAGKFEDMEVCGPLFCYLKQNSKMLKAMNKMWYDKYLSS